jgi:heme-binding protein
MRRLKQAALVFLVVFAAAQFVRPERANPAIDATRTIRAHMGSAGGLVAILDRSCSDCHSSATVWPWYTQIAPVSWVMARGVAEGRRAVNFSDWAAYTPQQQQDLLAASCDDASQGRMPGAYTLLRPDTRLSTGDIEAICTAARQAKADAPHGL